MEQKGQGAGNIWNYKDMEQKEYGVEGQGVEKILNRKDIWVERIKWRNDIQYIGGLDQLHKNQFSPNPWNSML